MNHNPNVGLVDAHAKRYRCNNENPILRHETVLRVDPFMAVFACVVRGGIETVLLKKFRCLACFLAQET